MIQKIPLQTENSEDVAFCREVFGFEAQRQGHFRERDRLFYFEGSVDPEQLDRAATEPPPASLLDPPPPPLPVGPVRQHLCTMSDGLKITWIRHPSALPRICRRHWREHTHLFVLENQNLGFTAYTSIFGYAHLEAADHKFRFLAPGGIRWIDYASKEAALCDALDMSLAVGMKIQVVGTPCAGNKIAVYGDYGRVGPALRSIFGAYERLGFVVTSADLGLSIDQLREWASPVAPTSLVPLGVYRKGLTSASITADAAFAGLHAMAESLEGAPRLKDLAISMQGIGEVGFQLAEYLVKAGCRLTVAETNAQTCEQFQALCAQAFATGQARFVGDPDTIYDAPADLFVPCALRDILTPAALERLTTAGVRMIGGPANNLFPDQTEGPWEYHRAGMPVVPYEGIGAGGVTGVAYSVMAGIFGRCPFTPSEKVDLIREYVARVMRWSATYDLPAQVVSDRILFRRARRRRLLQQPQADEMIEQLRVLLAHGDEKLEREWVNAYTKRGFFYGRGRCAEGGWQVLPEL